MTKRSGGSSDPRRDRPRGLRSRTAPRPRPAARRSPPLARAFVAKAVLGVPTTTALIERLDVTSRCDSFSVGNDARKCRRKRRFPRLRGVCAVRSARQDDAALIERSLGGRIVGVIARDATEIEARRSRSRRSRKTKVEDRRRPMTLSRRASADACARTRNGQNPSRPGSNADHAEPRSDARRSAFRVRCRLQEEQQGLQGNLDRLKNCIWMSPAAKSRSPAY